MAGRIKAAMKAAGFKTAKQFCEAHDVHYLTFAQHVQGRRSPTKHFLTLYSRAFNVSKDWLVTGEGDPLGGDVDDKQQSIQSEETSEPTRCASQLNIPILGKIIHQLLEKKYCVVDDTPKQFAVAAASVYKSVANINETEEIINKIIGAAVEAIITSQLDF